MRLKFEANISNLFNNRSAVAFNSNIIAGSGLISPTRVPRFSGDPGVDWGKIMNGFDPVAAFNAQGAFAGTVAVPCAPASATCVGGFKNSTVQKQLTLANRYGLGQVFQSARQIRLAFRFQF